MCLSYLKNVEALFKMLKSQFILLEALTVVRDVSTSVLIPTTPKRQLKFTGVKWKL